MGTGSTDAEHNEPAKASDGENDSRLTTTPSTVSYASVNVQTNAKGNNQADGKMGEPGKNDSGSQKTTSGVERLPQAGDVSSVAFATMSGFVALGAAFIASGKDLVHRSSETTSTK